MERFDVGEVLNVLAENCGEGWNFHKEDSVHVFLKNDFAKNPPHIRIRKDNGVMTCLCGQFQIGRVPIGYQITAEEFVKTVRSE